MPRSRIVSVGVSLPGRHFFGNTALAHAVRAGKDALKKSPYWPQDIELLIHAGVHRDKHYAEPAFACFIQRELGLNIELQGRQTFSYDLIDGAVGMLNAMDVLDAQIQAGCVEVGMVVASEANADKHPRAEYTTAKSGACVILDASPLSQVGFRSFRFRRFEKYADLYKSYVDLSVPHGVLHVDRDSAFEGACLNCVEETVGEYLKEEGLRPQDIDVVLPSQLSCEFVQSLGEKIGLPQDKIVNLRGKFLDTHTTSPILALSAAMSSKQACEGKRALFLSVGAGLNVGAALYEF